MDENTVKIFLGAKMGSYSGDMSRLGLILRLKGTVLLKIWIHLLFIMLYTTVIVCVHQFVPQLQFNFGQTLIPVMGVVTGLLLVFRTNTAYDRYWEGRRLWSKMTQHLRTITRLIWVGVQEPSCREVIEKKTAINLVVGFAYATKCYLREEYDYDYKELNDYIKHLPKFSTLPNNLTPRPNIEKKETVISMPEDEYRKSSVRKKSKSYFKAHDVVPTTNIPVELSYYICSYIEYLRARQLCDGSLLWTMTSAVCNLMDCLAGFERILRTPIPFAYSVHLHHAVWLYLLALPYQIIGSIHWWAIPAVTLASFSLLGILEIGWEIENPFGYDDNDLPLDDFCTVIKSEMQTITANGLPDVQSWLWSPENHPLGSNSMLTAEQLSQKPVEQVRCLLATGNEFVPWGKTFTKSSSLMSLFKNINEDSSKV